MPNRIAASEQSLSPEKEPGRRPCIDLRWEGNADCRHCEVRPHALFSALRGPDFERIALAIRSRVCPKGAVLYREGQVADSVYSIRRGMLKLTKLNTDEGDRIVRLLGRGAATGLEAMTHGLYWHTAIALREVELCRIPLRVFDELQSRHVYLSDQMVGQWEHQIVDADRWLVKLSTGPLHARVGRLVRLLAEMDAAEGNRLELPPMSDLANILGASRESVSRILAELKRGQVLRRVAPHTYEVLLEGLPC
jgi:CRP/FNR family transcriptional regulator, anaerobic regulatory protein